MKRELHLFEKTKITIQPIKLDKIDLGKLERVISKVLSLKEHQVVVVDVQEDSVLLDILARQIDPNKIFGKKESIFKELSRINGVSLFPETFINSDGVLGFIALDDKQKRGILDSSELLISDIEKRVAKRAIVFPTGLEIEKGFVKDMNSPYIKSKLEKEGFTVKIGPVLPDDQTAIRGMLRKASWEAFGLIITTGGIGAEEKDKTIEALIGLDPDASLVYTMEFYHGKRNRQRGGVRIGVGIHGRTFIVSLPGPNSEVKIAMEAVVRSIRQRWSKHEIAEGIAMKLKDHLLQNIQTEAYSHGGA